MEMAMEVSREAWAALRWHQRMVLINEFRILEEQKGAAPARRYEALARKALRSGHDGVGYMILSNLALKYYDEGDRGRHRATLAKARRLGEAERPGNLAAVELERRLGVSNGIPPDHQSEDIRETIAYEILLTTYQRPVKIRIRDLQALHDRAVADEKHLEAALCDLVLISEYRRIGDRQGEKSATVDLKRLEEVGVRDHEGKPYSQSLASNRNHSR